MTDQPPTPDDGRVTGTEPTTSPGQLPYEHREPLDYRWTERAYEFLTDHRLSTQVTGHDGSVIVVDGLCPRCEHPFTYSAITFAALVGTGGVLDAQITDVDVIGGEPPGADDDYLPVTVPCRCQMAHPGRATGGTSAGCGISFRLEVLRDGGER